MHRYLPTLALALLGSSFAHAEGPKPNFINIDDLGYADIGPFGSKLNRTPNLDRMAKEGMKFTSWYAAPVCSPSRASLMTGCYPKRVGIPNVLFPAAAIGLNPDEQTVAKLLKKQGYATICIGKWHLGDQPQFLPTRHGFDHYFGLPYSNDMGPAAKPVEGQAQRPPLPLLRDEKVVQAVTPKDQEKLVEQYTEEAVKFIADNKDRPFFLYLPHTAVHAPIHPGAKFQGKSMNGAYGDWVEEVDWSVGQVFDAVRAAKIEEKTLILFTSDNGGTPRAVNKPLRGNKASTLEGGMRVPTIFWWPSKVPAGTSCDAIASMMDVMPTLVKLAGGAVPTDRVIDGKDIAPLILGKSKDSTYEAFFFFNGLKLQAVRTGPWKLELASGKLYNLDADIGESTDVAAANAEVVKKLQEYVEKMKADLGESGSGPGCRAPGKVMKPQPLIKPEK
jgi:arylsulfatase A-like enzyme